MKTDVSDSSLIAYDKVRENGKLPAQQQKIVDFLGWWPGFDFTRKEISARTQIELCSVCGRVNELIKLGVLEEMPLRRCRVTDRKSTRLNSSHQKISYAVFCLKKKKSKR